MLHLDFKTAIDAFDRHVQLQKNNCFASNSKVITSLMDDKVTHTMNVIQDGVKVAEKLLVDKSFKELIKIALLNHDIGRFEQVSTTGSFDDSNLSFYLDHGELGSNILAKGLIKEQIPYTRMFDKTIINVVKNHVKFRVDQRDLIAVLFSGLLQYSDVYHIYGIETEKIQTLVDNFITQIVQDVDRLDIYRQIADGRSIPKMSNSPVAPSVLKDFYNGEYLDIKKLKQQKLWNANVGELARLSFINEIKFLDVAKMIKREGLLVKMKTLRDNPYIADAYDYTIDKLDEMIEKNNDGVVLYKKR